MNLIYFFSSLSFQVTFVTAFVYFHFTITFCCFFVTVVHHYFQLSFFLFSYQKNDLNIVKRLIQTLHAGFLFTIIFFSVLFLTFFVSSIRSFFGNLVKAIK